jgi:hypothetical protein
MVLRGGEPVRRNTDIRHIIGAVGVPARDRGACTD